MNKNEQFESDRLVYRGITEQDADCLVKWRSDLELIKYLRNPVPVTKDSHTDWYENSYLNNTSRYDFIIIEKESGKRFGILGVSNIRREDNSYEFAFMIGESSFRGQGFALEAHIAMMDRMYSEGYSNGYSIMHKDNIAMIKTIQKFGSTKIGEEGSFVIYKKVCE